jgi:hypothetical protein
MAPPNLPESDQALVDRVTNAYRQAEPTHAAFRVAAEKFYGLYRGFSDFRARARGGDRDEVITDAKKTWGAELFIPFVFSTIETIVPRMVAHNPRMIVVPRDEQSLGRVRNMKMIIDAQQKQIDYETILQTVAKDGLIYGLGVGKTRWKFETRLQTTIVPSFENPENFVLAPPAKTVTFDDAVAERVDPFDFIWDPMGDSMQNIEYAIHRQWRNAKYVRRMVEAGYWRASENDPECPWDLDDLLSASPLTQRSQIWDQRLAAEGFKGDRRDDYLHEVWEFHDGNQVITILDGLFPVQAGPNPAGNASIPFQIYRPTVVGGRFVGISEVEPIQHLQYEINTLRSQRRDAATLALMRTFAYNETAIDADDLVFGPGLAIPVNGDPREFLFPIEVPELPASSYREEQAIVDDIQRTSGISDPVTGGDVGASETATGVQLVQAAATMRIQNKTRLLENAIIVPQGYEFIALNQRRILTSRTYAVPAEPDPNNPLIPAWEMVKVGPRELMGRMAIEVEGGSTAPENVPQQRQDAQMFVQLSQDPRLDGNKLLMRGLELMGINQPEGYLAPQAIQVPAPAIEAFLTQIGVPPEAFAQFMAQLQAQQQQQNGGASNGAGPTNDEPQEGPPQGVPVG